MDDIEMPDNILRIGATPHHWLLPHTSVVIHHGGSGTTHSATRAGKPSVVIPFAGDQSFWAERLNRLGIAPPALDGAKLDARSLGKAIGFVENIEVQKRAAELGEQMEREDGLATAVREIEKLIN
jgi:sterol 3beta-glucosyltransferase